MQRKIRGRAEELQTAQVWPSKGFRLATWFQDRVRPPRSRLPRGDPTPVASEARSPPPRRTEPPVLGIQYTACSFSQYTSSRFTNE